MKFFVCKNCGHHIPGADKLERGVLFTQDRDNPAYKPLFDHMLSGECARMKVEKQDRERRMKDAVVDLLVLEVEQKLPDLSRSQLREVVQTVLEKRDQAERAVHEEDATHAAS